MKEEGEWARDEGLSTVGESDGEGGRGEGGSRGGREKGG